MPRGVPCARPAPAAVAAHAHGNAGVAALHAGRMPAQVAAQKLWPAYVRPVREGSARLDEHSKLHAALAPLLRSHGPSLAAAGCTALSLSLTSGSSVNRWRLYSVTCLHSQRVNE